jgi:hypothetical protein
MSKFLFYSFFQVLAVSGICCDIDEKMNHTGAEKQLLLLV